MPGCKSTVELTQRLTRHDMASRQRGGSVTDQAPKRDRMVSMFALHVFFELCQGVLVCCHLKILLASAV
jgi:hypothetical protein